MLSLNKTTASTSDLSPEGEAENGETEGEEEEEDDDEPGVRTKLLPENRKGESPSLGQGNPQKKQDIYLDSPQDSNFNSVTFEETTRDNNPPLSVVVTEPALDQDYEPEVDASNIRTFGDVEQEQESPPSSHHFLCTGCQDDAGSIPPGSETSIPLSLLSPPSPECDASLDSPISGPPSPASPKRCRSSNYPVSFASNLLTHSTNGAGNSGNGNDSHLTVNSGMGPRIGRTSPRSEGEKTSFLSRNISLESTSSSRHEGASSHRKRRVKRNRSVIPAPDGGWGWVVVFSSFMISMIADGISFSFGVIFTELSEHFNETKSKTAFVGSLFMSIPLLAGPLASALTDRYGCRNITILSGIISCLGFVLGHLSTSIGQLCLAFSIAGAGLALSYVTSIVIVAYYFEKKRSLATGLAVCGTGFGTFVFAPLTMYLQEEYTWRGTLLIMAGFFLNIVVFGALMRDLPDEFEDDNDSENHESSVFHHNLSQETINAISSFKPYEPFTPILEVDGEMIHVPSTSSRLPVTPSSHLIHFSNKSFISAPAPRISSSLVHIPTFLTHRGSICDDDQEVINELSVRKGGYLSKLMQRYPQIIASAMKGKRERLHTFNTIEKTDKEFARQFPAPCISTNCNQPITSTTTTTTTCTSTSSNAPTTLLSKMATPPLIPLRGSSPLGSQPLLVPIPGPIPSSLLPIHVPKDPPFIIAPPASNLPTVIPTKVSSPIATFKSPPRGHRLSVIAAHNHRLNSLIPFESGLQARKLQRGSITYRSAIHNIRRNRVRSSSCPDMATITGSISDSNIFHSSSCMEEVKGCFADFIDVSIFKSLKYSLFCFSNLLLYACIDVPYVYIPDHAIKTEVGGKEEASFLISLIGMVNTFGIVLVGYIGDKPWLEPSILYSCLICLSGISIALIPFFQSYAVLAFLSSMYGLTISANYALVSVILVELISLDKFTAGYGLLLLVQGIASLIGPPFAGWLCDITGSYDVTFMVTGMCIFVSGAVVLPVARSAQYCIKSDQSDSDREREGERGSHSPSSKLPNGRDPEAGGRGSRLSHH